MCAMHVTDSVDFPFMLYFDGYYYDYDDYYWFQLVNSFILIHFVIYHRESGTQRPRYMSTPDIVGTDQ